MNGGEGGTEGLDGRGWMGKVEARGWSEGGWVGLGLEQEAVNTAISRINEYHIIIPLVEPRK